MHVRAWEGDSGSIFSTQTHGIKEKVVYVRVFSFKISIFRYMEGRSLATWCLNRSGCGYMDCIRAHMQMWRRTFTHYHYVDCFILQD